MKRISFITMALGLSLTLFGCKSPDDENGREELSSVYAFTPKSNACLSSTFHTSSIEEGKSVSVSFKTGGQIKRLTASEGEYVRKGQTIGFLDDKDYRLTLKQLETQYAQVSSEIKRIEEMYRHNSVSQNDYEKAKSGLQQLKIQLDLTRNQLSYTQLTAPISGHIVERFMEEGEMVGAGTPVYRIVDNSGVEASVSLSANAYSKRDQIVKCVGRSTIIGDEEIPLDIISFIPDGDSNSLFKLRLKIPGEYRDKLLPGMNMSVEILYNVDSGRTTHIVPSRALFERKGKTYVWVINRADSVLSAHEVSIVGAPEGQYSQINGLENDVIIVAAGVHHLYDNQKVKVIGRIDDLKEKSAL